MNHAEFGSASTIEMAVRQLNVVVQPNILLIDNGFNPERPGWCANAVIARAVDRLLVATALHTTHPYEGAVGTLATIIDPMSNERYVNIPFQRIGPDTALSELPYSGRRPGLRVAKPRLDDMVSFHGKRHVGNGEFVETPQMWGTIIGQTECPDDKKTYWQVAIECGSPQLGDSGSPGVLIGTSEEELTNPPLLGVFRRVLKNDNRGLTVLFSPLLS